jgi:simple sugar transport system ATP-binding protein
MKERKDLDAAVTGSFDGVAKRFDAFQAVDGVSFEIRQGSFHALLGENGAGKTTLMRMLAGELKPDSGSIFVDGISRRFRSARDARLHGIRLVHQHSLLIPNLTILENFLLVEKEGALAAGRVGLGTKIREEAAHFGIVLDPDRPVWELSVTQRRWIEVFRAIFGGGRILILDEPTALLSPLEGDALLEKLGELASSGMSIVLITHKLREVFRFADTVTVMRRGRWVATKPVPEVTEESLARMMVDEGPRAGDRAFADRHGRPDRGSRLVELREVVCVDHRGRIVLESTSLAVSRGEVLGVAGVSGNGQAQLARIVAGIERPSRGTVARPAGSDPHARYIPDDRIHVATAASLSLLDNLSLRDFQKPPCATRGLLDLKVLADRARARLVRFEIKAPSMHAAVSVLSGGNIQRVVIARELDNNPELVVAHNPTAGLDITTAAFVRQQLVEVANRGGGVLLISDDLDELLSLADRLVILHVARIVGVLQRAGFDPVLVARLMAGGTVSNGELGA